MSLDATARHNHHNVGHMSINIRKIYKNTITILVMILVRSMWDEKNITTDSTLARLKGVTNTYAAWNFTTISY